MCADAGCQIIQDEVELLDALRVIFREGLRRHLEQGEQLFVLFIDDRMTDAEPRIPFQRLVQYAIPQKSYGYVLCPALYNFMYRTGTLQKSEN
jgi:hypothetical protein